jgi:hypothetical protein
MERIEQPAARERNSSRSAKVNAKGERRRSAGRMPPVSAKIRWIDEWFQSNSWAIW